MLARSVTDVCLHVSSNAFCAAATALSTSFSFERATWQNVLPSMGEGLSKNWPSTGSTNSPPMKLR